MQQRIEFEVLGNPQALKRHRTYTKGKGGRPLPFPIKVDPSENDKADFLALAYEHTPNVPLKGPLYLRVVCEFPRPKSHYRTGKFKNQLKPHVPFWHTTRPDADNLLKFVADALDGVFFVDDNQIADCHIMKRYSETPKTIVIIEEISHDSH